MKQFWMIRKVSQGGGRSVSHGWTIHLLGDAPLYRKTLAEAKAWAVEHAGASGKWVRKDEPAGVRGKLVATYYDAEEASK